MQKPDISKLKKPVNVEHVNHDNEALFEMEGLDESAPDWTDGRPRTFAAAQLGEAGSEAHQAVQKISVHNDFRPIDAAPALQDDNKTNGNGKKKKKTRKVSSKKKHQRKSSTSSVSSQSDRAGSEQRPTMAASVQNDIIFFSDDEIATATLR